MELQEVNLYTRKRDPGAGGVAQMPLRGRMLQKKGGKEENQ